MGKRFLPTTIGTSQIPPSDPRLMKESRPKLRSHEYNTRRDPLKPLYYLRKDDSKIATNPMNRNELLKTLHYFQKNIPQYYLNEVKNELKGREEQFEDHGYFTRENTGTGVIDPAAHLQRHQYEIREASKNSEPQKVKPQPSPESKAQNTPEKSRSRSPKRGAERNERSPASKQREREAVNALHKAINESSLSILEKKRSVSRQRAVPTQEDQSGGPLIDTKIPQVTYLAQSSSLGSASRIVGAVATSTKQPALILERTQPPPTAPEKERQKEKTEEAQQMNQTASAKIYDPELTPISKGQRATESEIIVEPLIEESQIMVLSQSEERIVGGLEQGEHFVKLIPNDYWEFFSEQLQSFKKPIHGVHQTKHTIVDPLNRTAFPLDLANVQNRAFNKLIPRNDSNATIDFQKAFLRNKEAERYFKMKEKEIKQVQGIPLSSGSTLQPTSLLSATAFRTATSFKTSKFPVTQNPELHPNSLIPDTASYLPLMEQLRPQLDPPRAIGIPGKSPTKRLMTSSAKPRLGSSIHGERLRSAESIGMPIIMRECRTATASGLKKQSLGLTSTTPRDQSLNQTGSIIRQDPLAQEREYMKDWLLGRMYTNIDWVMQENEKRCDCCHRIHCLKKKKPRPQARRHSQREPVAAVFSNTESTKFASTSSKYRVNRDLERMLKTSETSLPFTPLSIQRAIAREEEKEQEKAPSFKAPSQLEEMGQEQPPNREESRTPSIFSPDTGAPELMQIQEHQEHSEQREPMPLHHQSMAEELEEVMMPIEPRLATQGSVGAVGGSIHQSDAKRESLHTSQKVEAENSMNEVLRSQDTGKFPGVAQLKEEKQKLYKGYASSTPWVSPFKVRHIRKKQKLSKVVANATKNLERPVPLSLAELMGAQKVRRTSHRFKNNALFGEQVILHPSAITPDPEEYRLTSVQGSRKLPMLSGLTLEKQSEPIMSQRTHPEENEYLNATIQQIIEQEKLPMVEKYHTIDPKQRVRWQDQIEEKDAEVRLGTADKVKPLLMSAIQEEGRKKRGKQPDSRQALSQKNAIRLGSTLLSQHSVAFSGSSQTPLRVFDVNRSMIEDRSLRKEEIKLAIRRPSPHQIFKLRGPSKTAVSFYKPHGGRKIIGGAMPRSTKKAEPQTAKKDLQLN